MEQPAPTLDSHLHRVGVRTEVLLRVEVEEEVHGRVWLFRDGFVHSDSGHHVLVHIFNFLLPLLHHFLPKLSLLYHSSEFLVLRCISVLLEQIVELGNVTRSDSSWKALLFTQANPLFVDCLLVSLLFWLL